MIHSKYIDPNIWNKYKKLRKFVKVKTVRKFYQNYMDQSKKATMLDVNIIYYLIIIFSTSLLAYYFYDLYREHIKISKNIKDSQTEIKST